MLGIVGEGFPGADDEGTLRPGNRVAFAVVEFAAVAGFRVGIGDDGAEAGRGGHAQGAAILAANVIANLRFAGFGSVDRQAELFLPVGSAGDGAGGILFDEVDVGADVAAIVGGVLATLLAAGAERAIGVTLEPTTRLEPGANLAASGVRTTMTLLVMEAPGA
jgi:hypothetical protein